MILETQRLQLREMQQEDYGALCKIVQDEDVMYAYEGAFSDKEAQDWLNKVFLRYKEDGISLWAVVLKDTNEMIGQCGLLRQTWKEKPILEVGYLFQKAYWHKGYATEAARACKEYAFDVLHEKEVFSMIRDSNIASQNVALRNGMHVVDTGMTHYRGVDMLHFLYSVRRTEEE